MSFNAVAQLTKRKDILYEITSVLTLKNYNGNREPLEWIILCVFEGESLMRWFAMSCESKDLPQVRIHSTSKHAVNIFSFTKYTKL